MKFLAKLFSTNPFLLLTLVFFFSCEKGMDEQTSNHTASELQTSATTEEASDNESIISTVNVVRVHNNDLSGNTWEEVQIDASAGGGANIPSYPTNHVSIECAPKYKPGLNRGAGFLELPRPPGSTLRRVRMNNNAYSGTKLQDLTALKYSTYILSNQNQSAPALVLQIDVNEDNIADYNLAFEPRKQSSNAIVFNNTWQEWDALTGSWQIGIGAPPVELENTPNFTLAKFLEINWQKPPQIINTTPLGVSSGGGIRFTIGGSPDFDNFSGYFDAFTIGIGGQAKPTLYDFVCDNS